MWVPLHVDLLQTDRCVNFHMGCVEVQIPNQNYFYIRGGVSRPQMVTLGGEQSRPIYQVTRGKGAQVVVSTSCDMAHTRSYVSPRRAE